MRRSSRSAIIHGDPGSQNTKIARKGGATEVLVVIPGIGETRDPSTSLHYGRDDGQWN